MDHHLKSVTQLRRMCAMALLALCIPTLLLADLSNDLADPTRPNVKRERIVVSTKVIAKPKEALVLQSTLVAPNRRLAIINGKTLYVGGRVADAEIIEISPHQVTLLRSGVREVLRLLPEKTALRRHILRGQNNVPRL